MKKVFFLAITLLLYFNSYSQSRSNFRLPTNNGNWAIKTTSSIKGNKYLSSNWVKGVLILNDSLVSQTLPLLFDQENNKLLGTNDKSDKNKGIELPVNKINGFKMSIDNKNYHFIKVLPSAFDPVQDKVKFYQKVTPSDNVIKDVRKYIYDFGKTNGFTKGGKVYKTKTTFYVKKKNKKYFKIKSLTKRSLIKVFGNKKRVKKYISDNDLDLENFHDLDMLINFCKEL